MADFNPEKLVRPGIIRMKPYIPVETVDALSRETGIAAEKILKLDGNENPYGCSPAVAPVLREFSGYHLYPDPGQAELKAAIAQNIDVSPSRIVAGCGVDEVIDLVLRLLIEPGDEVINCPPTFGMYQFLTDICGGAIRDIPRLDDFSLDIPALKKKIGKRTKIIFVASPNNPTGNLISEYELSKLLEFETMVVVDEAYSEFSQTSVIKWVDKYSNLAVMRTYSKWAGLAGFRIGYGVFPTAIVGHLMKIKQPYNPATPAVLAAIASINDASYLNDRVRRIIDERERFYILLREIPFLKPYTSQANFILCRVIEKDARFVWRELRKRGILTRYFDSPGLIDCIRISIGKPADSDRVITALKEI